MKHPPSPPDTLFVSECVMIYMQSHYADDLIKVLLLFFFGAGKYTAMWDILTRVSLSFGRRKTPR